MLKIRFTDQRRGPAWVADKSFAIGGAHDNQLVIEDPTVDEHHAKIIYANSQFLLQDLGGPQGIFVNDQRVTQKTIHNGDKVRIGGVELEILDPARPENQPEWCLVACSSWLAGQEFPVRARERSNEVKIGRASHCDMIFAGTHLSREHAQLTINSDGIFVRDLNSANGTFINDVRIAEGLAYSGDQLRLDVYSFRLYGPGTRPASFLPMHDEATNIRRPPPREPPEPADESSENGPKRWKTRPTSPGNRSDSGSPKDQYPLIVKIISACLIMAVTALATYLIIG